MSVYATVLMIQHPDAVKEQLGEQLTIVGDDSHERELGSPRLYQGSHVIPAASDKRGGMVEVGAIPAFVEDRRQGLPEEEVREEGWLPYVRLSVSTRNYSAW